jgi:hypothetical protein
MAEQNKGGEGGESIPRVLCAPRYAVEAQRRGFTRLPRPVPSQAEQRVEDVAREKKETAAEDQRTKRATKIVVSIILTENKQPDLLKRWFSHDDLDVRRDPTVGEQVLAFLNAHAPRSTTVMARIIGCSDKEGTDYPDGTACPQCVYWTGRDRFTQERIQ